VSVLIRVLIYNALTALSIKIFNFGCKGKWTAEISAI